MKAGFAILGAAALTVAALAKPVAYTPPEETAAYAPGPGVELAESNCLGCHSADYARMQPRGPGFGRDFWKAEVLKMKNVYHAPIDDGDVEALAAYLATAYAD